MRKNRAKRGGDGIIAQRKKALFSGDVVSVGNVTVADSREGFVSWSDQGVLIFRPGTYTIPKPINEMTQADLDACWTPSASITTRKKA